MGTDAAEVEETLPYTYIFEVHHSMCTELKKFIDRITNIFPDIEAARPRCRSGIEALCSLNSAVEKTKQLLQSCVESSKLYLAITGDVILLRCQKSKSLLEQSLCQIQTFVPVMLAAKVSRIIDDLRATTFVLDSSEEEAGNVLHVLLLRDASTSDLLENNEKEALKHAASRLRITSRKAIVLEMRAIKKQLTKVGEKDRNKKKILTYFLQLLKKYGSLIAGEQREGRNAWDDGLARVINSGNGWVNSRSAEVESRFSGGENEAQTNMFSRSTPPEKFMCPISGGLMYDPVQIASGFTFERMWIQKWFDEGNYICPRTNMKLANFSLTPNIVVRELISEWCSKNGVSIEDPNSIAFHSLDVSSTSIASLGSSMNDLHLPVDTSNVSFGSLDYNSDSRTKVTEGSTLSSMWRTEGSGTCQTIVNEADLELLSRLVELPWESQCKVVEDIKCQLQCDSQVCCSMSSEIYIGPLITFLRDALDNHDLRAQKAGSEFLLALVSKNRNEILCLHDDALSLLTSFLDSEVSEEALTILEILSGYPHCRSKFSESGVLVPLLKLLESPSKKFQEPVIKILHNVSSNNEICSQIVSLGCIPKLVPFISDGKLARFCIVLLKNLCDTEEARVSVAETNGCIASVAELLENGSHEEQEHAVDVLLSLCSMRVEYCHLAMDEGIIPSLVYISNNGSEKGKVMALELLRQLREDVYEDGQESLGSDLDPNREASLFAEEKRTPSKARGFFKRNFPLFHKKVSSPQRREGR